MVYEVKITEHRERIVKVKAADEDEAIAITADLIDDGAINIFDEPEIGLTVECEFGENEIDTEETIFEKEAEL